MDDRSAVAVFMCAVCEHSRESGLVRCSVNGVAIVEQVCGGVLKAKAGMECPVGKGPDESGIVKWMGVRWRGVPWPVKVMLSDDVMCGWFGAPRAARMEDMPGCGCIHVLRTWTERIGRWMGWEERDGWVAGEAG